MPDLFILLNFFIKPSFCLKKIVLSVSNHVFLRWRRYQQHRHSLSEDEEEGESIPLNAVATTSQVQAGPEHAGGETGARPKQKKDEDPAVLVMDDPIAVYRNKAVVYSF